MIERTKIILCLAALLGCGLFFKYPATSSQLFGDGLGNAIRWLVAAVSFLVSHFPVPFSR